MKQAIMHGARELRIEDRYVDPSRLEPDQLYVQTEVSALSTGMRKVYELAATHSKELVTAIFNWKGVE